MKGVRGKGEKGCDGRQFTLIWSATVVLTGICRSFLMYVEPSQVSLHVHLFICRERDFHIQLSAPNMPKPE